MIEGKFTVVPIVDGFGTRKPIGELRILTEALPPTPNFVFTLAFNALSMQHVPPGQIPTRRYCGAHELCEVTIAWDESYAAYLQRIGVMPERGSENDLGRNAKGKA